MKNLLLTMFVLLYSCSGGKDNGEERFTTLSIDPEKAVRMNVADYFEPLSVVPLETNDSVLISAIYNIVPADGKIYILDRQGNSTFVYSGQGKCEKVIHDQGQGPNEYTDLSCIAFDKNRKELHLVSNTQKKELVYDVDGRFLRNDTLPYKVTDILFESPKRKILLRQTLDMYGGFIMNCFENGEPVAQLHPFHYENGATVSTLEYPLKALKDGCYMHIVYNDTIYRYDFDQLQGGFVIDFGDKGIPAEIRNLPQSQLFERFYAYMKQRDYKVAEWPYLFYQEGQKVGINYVYDRCNYYYFYDRKKRSAESLYGPYIGDTNMAELMYAHMIRDGLFYFIIDPVKYHNLAHETKQEIKKLDRNLYDALEKTAEDDNPVLWLARLK